MDRRELLKLATSIASTQMPGTLSVVHADSAPILAILELQESISIETADHLRVQVNNLFKDIPGFHHVKVLVLGPKETLTFFDADGEVCTKEIIREFANGYTVRRSE